MINLRALGSAMTIGDILRRERLKRNLEVSQIAAELKISARFIDAIEADDFSKLPGGVFTRSFVRQYAMHLGLDGEEVAAEMRRLLDPQPNEEAEAVSNKSKPDVPGIPMGGGANWQSVSERRPGLPPWFRAGALLVVLMLVCSAVYWWWQRPRHQAAAVEAPLARVAPTPAPTPPPQQPENAPPPTTPAVDASATPLPGSTPAAQQPAAQTASASTPPAAAIAPAAATPANAPNPNASVRVQITADDAVWIRAEVNGKYAYSGTLQAHEVRNFDGEGEVKLRLGNAGNVSINLNGKPVGPVGPKGQIRTVQFTSGGFQIVSPPKSLDPLDRL